MKRIVLVAALMIGLAPLANAGSLTFGVKAGAVCPAPSAGVVCINLSDADTARVIAWAKDSYGQLCDVAVPPVCRARTNAETLDAIATGIFRGLRDNVKNYERELARKPAGDAVAPIGVQ